MAIKFPLKMADGAMARTLEELKEHFDIASLLSYYDDGRLVKWLENGYYDDEAQKVSELDVNSENFAKDLCEVLGIENADDEKIKNISVKNAAERNSRIAKLRQLTVDDNILAAVDRVAFTQEELDALLKNDIKEVYLCGENFTIPTQISDITYIGVNNPIIRLDKKIIEQLKDPDNLMKSPPTMSIEDTIKYTVDKLILDNNNVLQSCRCYLEDLIDDYSEDEKEGLLSFSWPSYHVDGKKVGRILFSLFEFNLETGLKFLHIAAEAGSPKIQTFLGNCYEDGLGIERDLSKACIWYKRAAEQGYPAAQFYLGICYIKTCYNKDSVDKKDLEEAVKWFRLAAEQGLKRAQYNMSICYDLGIGLKQDKEEGYRWRIKSNLGGILSTGSIPLFGMYQNLYE